MRLLLDTHVLLWWLADRQLTSEARELIAHPANDVLVSAASAWEITIKRSLGKLHVPDDLPAQLVASSFAPLDVTIEHGLAVAHLPRHHDDPFDRMLIAQAAHEGLTIVTRDERFTTYDVRLVRA